MNLILTSEVPALPDDLLIGWNTIQAYQENNTRFIDQQFIDKHPTGRRKDEHYSARKLFSDLLKEMKLSSEIVELRKMELGKPYGKMGKDVLFTSFSHSKTWVICAMSLTLDVGVDCEPLSREVNPRVMKRILNESENYLLDELSSVAIWTMKEAVVKCLGTGIRTSLQKFKLRKEGELFFMNYEGNNIQVHHFQYKDHQLAVAWRI